jgi:aldose 1-epimerase
MAVTERTYDPPGLGRVFTLTSGAITAEIIEYGARLRSCTVPDAAGRIADIVPGFDSPADYIDRGGSMGAICGRYGNRIAHGRIEVDGEPLQLSVNAPPHCLHGGFNHFGRHFWKGTALPDENAVRLTFISPDGDEGWPGTLSCEVVYRLEGRRLHIEMKATTDRATFVNLIFHGYWNLSGHASGSIDDHLLQVAAERYTPKNDLNVPSGEFELVEGTPADFRALRRIGQHVSTLPSNGYDHNLCLDHPAGKPDIRLVDPKSGRSLTITTNQPGVQLFTANNWSSLHGKDGAVYQARAGVALETQAHPNTPNIPSFNPTPLRPDEIYTHTVVLEFGASAPEE